METQRIADDQVSGDRPNSESVPSSSHFSTRRFAKRWGYDAGRRCALLQLDDAAPVGLYEVRITTDCSNNMDSGKAGPGVEYAIQVDADKEVRGEIWFEGEMVDTFWSSITKATCPRCGHSFDA